MDIKEQVIDSMHWREYTVIQNDNTQITGSLTQGSEEQIADTIIPLVRADMQRETRDRNHKRHRICSICYRKGVKDSADYLKNTYDQPTMAKEILSELH